MAIGDRGPAGRAERVRSSYHSGDQDGDDRDWNSPAGGGLTRILIVVILLHVAGIAGVLGYRWLHPGEDGKGDPAPGVNTAKTSPIEEVLPPPPVTNGKAIVVEHPSLKGHVRYRVGKNEQLIDVARRFNASVAEVENLNNLRSETPLYTGQWLTVPDHRENPDHTGGADPASDPAKLATVKDKPAPVSNHAKDPALRPEPGPKKVIAQPEPPKVEPPIRDTSKVEPPKPRTEPVHPTPVAVPSPVPVPVAGEIYKVNSGDTAYRIALKYGVTWQELLQANGMSDPKQLRAGQVIKIPPKR